VSHLQSAPWSFDSKQQVALCLCEMSFMLRGSFDETTGGTAMRPDDGCSCSTISAFVDCVRGIPKEQRKASSETEVIM
jgi:hypothetical protein